MNAMRTSGPQRQVRYGANTYLAQRVGDEFNVRVLGADGVWRKTTSERIRFAVGSLYRAANLKVGGSS